jgi:small subunit ribosomal protein S15
MVESPPERIKNMPLTTQKKAEIIQKSQQSDGDTGSPEVQVALLTERINTLGQHFELHKKDHHSRHGLLKLVNSRRKLLDYLKSKNSKRYKDLISSLGLRR